MNLEASYIFRRLKNVIMTKNSPTREKKLPLNENGKARNGIQRKKKSIVISKEAIKCLNQLVDHRVLSTTARSLWK